MNAVENRIALRHLAWHRTRYN